MLLATGNYSTMSITAVVNKWIKIQFVIVIIIITVCNWRSRTFTGNYSIINHLKRHVLTSFKPKCFDFSWTNIICAKPTDISVSCSLMHFFSSLEHLQEKCCNSYWHELISKCQNEIFSFKSWSLKTLNQRLTMKVSFDWAPK